MVIPIEDAMTNRENFTPILSVVMVIYTTLCVFSGGLGYMAFGDETEVCGVWVRHGSSFCVFLVGAEAAVRILLGSHDRPDFERVVPILSVSRGGSTRPM